MKAPLYQKYPGQTGPQPAYLELDCTDGSISADWSAEIGNGIPARVFHRHAIRFHVSPELSESEVAEMLADENIIGPAAAIHHGYESKWNGSNSVGRFTEDAQQALNELEDYMREHWQDGSAQVWDALDWMSESPLDQVWPAHKSLRQAVEALEAEAEESGCVIEGSIETALLEKALGYFESDPNHLNPVQVGALYASSRLNDQQLRQWLDSRGE